jgi:hypothetical protein
MNDEDDLIAAYHEWRRLSDAVGQGMADGDWNQVALGQRTIGDLQKKISRLSPVVRAEWARAGTVGAIKESILNQLIQDLMDQVRHNQARLVERKQAVRRKLDETGVATRNLKRLRCSYVVSRPGRRTAWA